MLTLNPKIWTIKQQQNDLETQFWTFLDLKNTIFEHYKPKYLQILTKMWLKLNLSDTKITPALSYTFTNEILKN